MSHTATAKRPWIAVVLSVVFPGLGHVYLREWLRTAMWLSLLFVTVSLLIPPEIVPQQFSVDAVMEASRNLPTDVSFAIVALRAMNVVDAYLLARRNNQRQAITSGLRCPECGKELEDPSLSFCPWCAAELDAVVRDDGATTEDNDGESRFDV